MKNDTTILLDIYERLGAIESELKHVIKTNEKLSEENKSRDVEIEDLKDFKKRIAAYIWFGSSILSGTLFFLWEGIKYAIERWGHN